MSAVKSESSCRGKGTEIPVKAYYRPRGLKEVEAPRFQNSQHLKMVRLSALFTGCLFPPGIIPATNFC